jgi:hypothetical protein
VAERRLARLWLESTNGHSDEHHDDTGSAELQPSSRETPRSVLATVN